MTEALAYAYNNNPQLLAQRASLRAADEGVPIREVAAVIGRHLNVPVRSIAPEDVAGHFTWLSHFIGMDSPASSAITRELLGWQPVQVGLLADLDEGHYFSDK